ncbi:hypothetical protein [Geomonas oryzae]|uniref:hypothetical protein n=1 Tax=Geomonas oryzae TaxID=2364273 RepID=UPI00100C1F82|nr:hypothetical protein [Geomonas oryzae]
MTMINKPAPVPQEYQAPLALRCLVEEDLRQSLGVLPPVEGPHPNEGPKTITGEETPFWLIQTITKNHGVDSGRFLVWATYTLSPHEKSSLLYRLYLGRSDVLDRLVEKFLKEVS